ncbi:BtrH N-terminal domain-containing protein [Paenibacillus sp. Marseille-P2973]|uniref:BtrH N-terminal domain-containing protein n=1 Tax=Paenibacillus sp. Marseille-P2973 TaxID=1871032 RepID=UPI001B359C58|nr:BtrH N-terminal domain-containing protein [Paenibacillus sp. Marseille-P2973]MBQ4898038.1 BtrH N-terminal domain-containing protein [Paenibacillus sp. Marseille-P2973]
MIIKNFSPFSGEHCETTATGTLLKSLGIELSEAMLFGIGGGLGFIYWDMKNMDFPFIGGRIKPDLLTRNIVNNLNLQMEVKETSSPKKAWENVKENVDQGNIVGLKLDCYHLDYFTNKVHFAGHYVAMYGYDDHYAYLVDTRQQGGMEGLVKTSLENLALARNEKGQMSSKNLSYTIRKIEDVPDLRNVIIKAILENANDYINPPIKNLGYKGIKKTSVEINKWLERSKNIEDDLVLTATLMERGGTGGSLFRNMYRDFLKECLTIFDYAPLQNAYDLFSEIAPMWEEVSELIRKAGESQEIRCLNQASDLLLELSNKEYEAMNQLSRIS